MEQRVLLAREGGHFGQQAAQEGETEFALLLAGTRYLAFRGHLPVVDCEQVGQVRVTLAPRFEALKQRFVQRVKPLAK